MVLEVVEHLTEGNSHPIARGWACLRGWYLIPGTVHDILSVSRQPSYPPRKPRTNSR